MKVKQLIKLLKKMPQDEKIGYADHDMDCGDSNDIYSVDYVEDEEACNDRETIDHRVVIRG